MAKLKDFFCLSAHSKWTPLNVREKLSLDAQVMHGFLKSFKQKEEEGFFYLPTCHRVEVYGFSPNPTELKNKWFERSQIKEEQALKTWRGLAALEHFSRVASGLESEILGEKQIMAQVRSSLRESKEAALMSLPLARVLQKGLRVARNIRVESRIGEGSENLSSLAILSLHDIFESFHEKNFLIVGAGNMALLAIEKLRQLKVSNITWINRNRERIESHPYSRFCKVEDYNHLIKLVSLSDVTLLATSSAQPLVTKDLLHIQRSSKKPDLRVVLDLGLPRNASTDVSELGFILRDVDSFHSILSDKDALQKERADFAEKVLKRDLKSILQELDLNTLGPLKSEYLNKWKFLGEEILLENSPQVVYNRERFWAKLGHLFMMKANELGPLEGGHFLRHLCEAIDAFEEGRAEAFSTEDPKKDSKNNMLSQNVVELKQPTAKVTT